MHLQKQTNPKISRESLYEILVNSQMSLDPQLGDNPTQPDNQWDHIYYDGQKIGYTECGIYSDGQSWEIITESPEHMALLTYLLPEDHPLTIWAWYHVPDDIVSQAEQAREFINNRPTA